MEGIRAINAWLAQELVKLLVDRPRVVDALLEEPHNGSQASGATTSPSADLDTFVTWLWPLTACSERYCRS